MPCPLPASLTPRGSVTFRTTIRPRNLHPLKATQSPICTTQSRPMAGHKSQRRNPHPSRRRQRHERLPGEPVAKREMQQFQGILLSRVPHPHPWHDHPRSPFMFVGHSSDLLRAVPFKPPRLSHRGEPTSEGRSPYQHALFCSFARSFTMSLPCPQNCVSCPRNSLRSTRRCRG